MFNGCDQTIPEALRFLAEHDRPSGGEQRFNTLHLYQLADEADMTFAAMVKAERIVTAAREFAKTRMHYNLAWIKAQNNANSRYGYKRKAQIADADGKVILLKKEHRKATLELLAAVEAMGEVKL